jgi:hypothetical protein
MNFKQIRKEGLKLFLFGNYTSQKIEKEDVLKLCWASFGVLLYAILIQINYLNGILI